MSEQIVTDEEIEDFIGEGPDDGPEYHTVLEVWKAVLSNAPGEAAQEVPPAWASRIVTSYPQIQYQDMERFRDLYFGLVIELANIVELEIETDDECLNNFTPEDDIEHNTWHYKNILRDWQLAVLQRELDWRCTNDTAAIELAVIGEVNKMFFGDQGFTQHLGQIKMQFDEADQAELSEALDELKEANRE